MRVYINTLSWYVGKSTDLEIHRRFKLLEKDFPNVHVCYPNTFLGSLKYNIYKIAKVIIRRLKRTKPRRRGFIIRIEKVFCALDYKKSKCDVVYGQGVFPLVPDNIPIVYDTFFLKPEDIVLNPTAEMYKDYNNEIITLSEIVKKNVIINFRSNKSIKEAIEIWPNQINKFVNIPFLLPNLEALGINEIIKKHTDATTLKILFVGAQARRKGLNLIVDSLVELWNDGFKNWELHVVSSCSDGLIEVKDDMPINMYGAKDYLFVLDLFRTCHVYAMVSNYESFGISYIEAQANGLISLLRDFEPQREIADYGRLGVLVKPEKEDIKEGLARVLNMSQQSRIKMALECRENFIIKYEYRVVAKQWYNAFFKAMEMKDVWKS
ncbi:MAG: glycosyltransferase [Bacteroidales bacterium]|nr:glycosyltransferase [Bacteroidales bacterium]